jgi:hypothetical protein
MGAGNRRYGNEILISATLGGPDILPETGKSGPLPAGNVRER